MVDRKQIKRMSFSSASSSSSSSGVVNLGTASASTRRKIFSSDSACSRCQKNVTCIAHKPLKITRVRMYKTKLSQFQLTSFMFYHNFVVFQTEDGKYWTIERNTSGIIVQYEKSENGAENYLGYEKRLSPSTEKSWSSSWGSIKHLDEWLESSGEYNKSYDPVFNNCQHFAHRVYNYLT